MAEEMYSARSAGSSRISIIVLSMLLLITFLVGGVLVYKQYFGKRTVQAFITNKDISIRDSLEFFDKTMDANSWEWDFGNGVTSLAKMGKYKFDKPGLYQVKLKVDDDLTAFFPVTVRDTVAAPDTLVMIDGPPRAVVGEEIRFSARGAGRRWEWKFGVTGAVDMYGPEAFYKYLTPGTFTVQLFNGENKLPATLRIKIIPQLVDTLPLIDPKVEAEKREKQRVIDLRSKLQMIANDADFNTYYYDILRNYLCDDENTLVNVNGKNTDYYKYCTHLHFEKGIVIDEIVLQQGPNGCITQLTIKEHTKLD